jgi:2-iminobutanoate/2-iminopropanoate deaminase
VAKDEQGELIAPNDAEGQAKAVFDHLLKVLAHAGATPQDIVKMTTYLVDRADSKIVTEERFRFLGDHRPPHTGVIIAGLGAPEVKLEVEVIAVSKKPA